MPWRSIRARRCRCSESLREISAQRAEQFLNTFYFQYGHRSIADLAHIAFAVERLSLLAAIVLVDEQRWDGQERSTRYQNFLKRAGICRILGTDTARGSSTRETVESSVCRLRADCGGGARRRCASGCRGPRR